MSDSLKDLIEQTTAYKLPTHDKATTEFTPNTYSLLGATNKAIEDDIRNYKEQSNDMVQSLRYFYDVKDKIHKTRLEGFIQGGTALAKWIQDENKAHKIYEEHKKLDQQIRSHKELNRIVDLYKDNFALEKLDKAGFNWDVSDVDSPLFETNDPEVIAFNKALAEKSAIKAELNKELLSYAFNETSEWDPHELYLLTSDTPSGKEINDKEALFQKIDDFKTVGFQVAGSHVFKAGSITNSRGEPLPRDMSYFEALESTNIEINAWAPYLEQALWSAYYSYWNKDYNLAGLSDREIKNRIFKPFLEEVKRNRNTIVNAVLDKRVGNAKQKRYMDLLAQLQSIDPVNGGMRGITGPGGYIAQNEIGLDGTKDNNQAWWSFYDDIDFMVQKEIIYDGNRLQSIIDQPFKNRATGKDTYLYILKPEVYSRLSNLATKLKAKTANNNELAQQETINGYYEKVAPLALEAFNNGSETDIAAVLQQISEAKKSAMVETGLPDTHRYFNNFRLLTGKLSYTEAYKAVVQLERLDLEADGYLDWSLINQIPNRIDLGNGPGRENEKQYWINKANAKGAIGLGPDELEFYYSKLRTQVMRKFYPKYIAAEYAESRRQVIENSREYQNVKEKFLSEVKGEMAANEKELNSINHEDREKLERKLAEGAYLAIEKHFNNDKEKDPFLLALQQDQNPYDRQLQTVDGVTLSPYQIESNQLADTFAETGGEFEQLVGFPYYWSGKEQHAIEEFLNGVSPDEIQYYQDIHSNYRKFPQIPIEDIIKARVEATKDLRKEDSKEPITFSSGSGIPKDQYKDLCVYPSGAKTGQKLCSNPEIGAWMLEKLVENYQGQESDINTIRNGNEYKDSLIDDRPVSEITLREIITGTPVKVLSQRYGKYGLTVKRIHEQIQKQGIDPNLPFSEDVQNQIMLGLIFDIANKGKEFSTLTSDYKRIKWLSPETIQGFNAIIESKNPALIKYFKSPYNQIHVLSTAAANEFVDIVGEN